MRYDWTPLWRSTVGFDRLFDAFDEVQKAAEDNYPLYNIEREDASARAVAALDRIGEAVVDAGVDDQRRESAGTQLTLDGRKAEKEGRDFLYRGISARPFKRQFTLADHVEVKSASFENGLLVIELAREIPEAMKPRKIEIGATAPKTVSQIDARAA